ncbi:MAG: YchJ family metal-binding protein [Proteobacteria bacterium]|nr:YchJ family metal-binding protein [Pseudomonadota bacterium]
MPHGKQPCVCGSGATRENCCGPYVDGIALATTPERCMRSRYCAYVERPCDYLLASWDPLSRPSDLECDPAIQWLGLKILRAGPDALNEAQATVEFVARYRHHGRGFRLHEISRFRLIESHWFYVDGTHKE